MAFTINFGSSDSVSITEASPLYKGEGTRNSIVFEHDSESYPGCTLIYTMLDGSVPSNKPSLTITGTTITIDTSPCMIDCSVTKTI